MVWGWAGQKKKTYNPHFIVGPVRLSKSLDCIVVTIKWEFMRILPEQRQGSKV